MFITSVGDRSSLRAMPHEITMRSLWEPPQKRAKTSPTGSPSSRYFSSKLLLPLPYTIPVPPIHPILIDDVISYVLEFIDGPSGCQAAAVSKAFRDALIPRQRNVNLSGFSSPKGLLDGTFPFQSAQYLSGRDCDWVTDAFLRTTAAPTSPFPNISRIDLSGCKHMSSRGVKALVKGLGSRLTHFTQASSHKNGYCKDIKVTEATIKALAMAEKLQRLDLILPTKCRGECLQVLNEHESLEELHLLLVGFCPIRLPKHLPNLKELTIDTTEWTKFNWQTLETVNYPNLLKVTIHDRHNGEKISPLAPEMTLSQSHLLKLIAKAPLLQTVYIKAIGRASQIYNEDIQLLEGTMKKRNIVLDISLEEDFL